jgi:hypothetical protein
MLFGAQLNFAQTLLKMLHPSTHFLLLKNRIRIFKVETLKF